LLPPKTVNNKKKKNINFRLRWNISS
jgi:hypothetical protein